MGTAGAGSTGTVYPVSSDGVPLCFPPGLDQSQRDLLADRNDRAHGADLVGLVLSGSAGRELATARAWAPILLDRTGGRLAGALTRQATLTEAESESILVTHYRLDGWLNYAYRALKDDRDGRLLERRLDAVRATFAHLEQLCLAYDRERGTSTLGEVIDGWHAELPLLRG